MANSDSTTKSIPVIATFTDQGAGCVTPAFVEFFQSVNFRIDLPTTSTGSTGSAIPVSTLADNLFRLDGQGAAYVPAAIITELQEQTITLLTTTAPGVPVTATFGIPGISSVNTTFKDIEVDIQPPSEIVTRGPARIAGGTLSIDFYRGRIGTEVAPFPQVVIKVSGRLVTFPSPSPT